MIIMTIVITVYSCPFRFWPRPPLLQSWAKDEEDCFWLTLSQTDAHTVSLAIRSSSAWWSSCHGDAAWCISCQNYSMLLMTRLSWSLLNQCGASPILSISDSLSILSIYYYAVLTPISKIVLTDLARENDFTFFIMPSASSAAAAAASS